MKYIYSGPASGVTLADGQEVLLWPIAKSRYRKITSG
ncbi:gp12 [Salmonella enterica subsp. enterica]|uniref:Gp12 n=1 Tax=Salmonella enterica I TaxID=59201 RepID=A0A379X2C8_SALET|nr:gp12 [Salmonella enterica subsp. enterica]